MGDTVGRPRLALAVKAARGTLRPSRERTRPKAKPRKPAAPGKPRNYTGIADAYVADVLAGRIVACAWVRKAAERFERMRARAGIGPTGQEGPINTAPFTFSRQHADDVCTFVEKLPHVEGRWTTETITLQPWQVFILVACYGFRRPDGRRLVTTVFFQVARKSAKSTLVAAVALYHLAVEQEPGAQVVCAASTGAQARIVFGVMQRMIRRAAWLRELGLVAWAHAITFDAIGGTAKPINSKSSTQDGLNPSLISLDESHAQTFELRDVLVSAMGARPDGMIWCPTTAGYDLTSVGYALRATACKILDGVIESDHTFCVLYELDEADDWRDPRVWIKSAPMLGITPTLDYVRRYCADAQATPGMQGEFETKICNRWLHSATGWLSMPAWDRCAEPSLRLEDLAGQPCWIGVDLAERDDIAAVALTFRRGDAIVTFVRGYLPGLVVSERARAVPEYRAWVQSGELIVTDGDMTDYTVIEADLRALCATFDVQAIVVERYGALNLAANLSNSGLPARIESKNAKVFTAPMKELEARIKTGKLRHSGSTFLKWQASNVCCERRRDGSLLSTKDAATSAHKIDAIDALILALSALIEAPAAPSYDIRFIA
jgi:phage terminase large subunit-like protein